MSSLNPRVTALIEKLGYLQKTQYSSIENIAEGGMGSILRVFDERLQRHIALKLVKVGNDDEAEENIARFIQEARITAQLEHPNIMPVHELGMDDYGNIYFAMKEIKGESLEDLLRNIIRFPAMRVPLSHLLDIFLKILDGLSFAHSKGVIHRDLKPGNIMLGAYGEVLILDWGIAITKNNRQHEKNVSIEERNAQLAKIANERANIPFQTMAGCVLGTPEYMPPEQAMGLREEIDERSDIYAIGIIMYQMLTTHLPFVAEDPLEVLDMAVNVIPPSPKELLQKKRQEGKSQTRYSRREIPEALDQIVMKCIKKNKADRYLNAKELKKEILTFLDTNTLSQKDSGKKGETSKTTLASPEKKPDSSLEINISSDSSEKKVLPLNTSSPNAPTKILPDPIFSVTPPSTEPALPPPRPPSTSLSNSFSSVLQNRGFFAVVSRKTLFGVTILFSGLTLLLTGLFIKFNRTLQEKENFYQSMLVSALFLNERHEYSKALNNLQIIQDTNEKKPIFWYTRFKTDLGAGETQNAILDLQQLLTMKEKGSIPESWIFFQLGEIHRVILKNTPEALNYYLKSTQSKTPDCYVKLSSIYIALEQNKISIAKDLIQKESSILEKNWEFLLLSARVAEQEGKEESRKKFLEKAILLAPTQAEPFYEMGRCLQKLGNLEEALFYFTRSCQLIQKHPYYLLGTGEHLKKMGNHKLAKQYFAQAISVASGEAKKQIELQVKQYQ